MLQQNKGCKALQIINVRHFGDNFVTLARNEMCVLCMPHLWCLVHYLHYIYMANTRIFPPPSPWTLVCAVGQD